MFARDRQSVFARVRISNTRSLACLIAFALATAAVGKCAGAEAEWITVPRLTLDGHVGLAFGEGFQSGQSVVPLAGHAFKVRLDVPQRLGSQRKQTFASSANAVYDAGAFQHAQVLGDRLAREA